MTELFAGRYELVDPLGQGGMGTVWRAWDHRARQYLAAKVLRYSDAVSLLRFVREQSLRIDHPHVVRPIGWAAEDERVLFTMPLVHGGSVAALLGDFRKLPVPWAVLLLDQLLDALTAVHVAAVVHRDVKPANLLLEPTGRGRPHLRLSDFGVAAPINEPRLTRTDMVPGTPGYLAPERLRGADPHPREDLYSAGVVAAELLIGQRPDIGRAGVAEACPAGVPHPLWRVVGRLAAPEPGNRPASAAAARAELAATGLVPRPGEVPDDQGEAIEVFDQIPDLPSGWGPEGPDRPVRPVHAARPAPATVAGPPGATTTQPTQQPTPPKTEPATEPTTAPQSRSAHPWTEPAHARTEAAQPAPPPWQRPPAPPPSAPAAIVTRAQPAATPPAQEPRPARNAGPSAGRRAVRRQQVVLFVCSAVAVAGGVALLAAALVALLG